MVVVDNSLSGTRLYAPVKYLSKLPAMVQPGLAGAERLFEFMDAPARIRNAPPLEDRAPSVCGLGGACESRRLHRILSSIGWPNVGS